MTDDRHPPSEYRWARQVSAVLLIAVVVLVVVLDVIVEGYEVSPPVLVPLLLTAAGLLAVDLPRVRPSEPSPSCEPPPSLDRSIPLLLPNVGRPLTTDELLDVRAELVPARPPVALVAEASIDLHPRMRGVFCPQDRDLCMIGALVTTDGTMPVVYADRTVRELYQRSRDSIDGILASELRRYLLRFLGRVVVPPDGTLVQPVSPETMACRALPRWLDQRRWHAAGAATRPGGDHTSRLRHPGPGDCLPALRA